MTGLRRIVSHPLVLMIVGAAWLIGVAIGLGSASNLLGFASNTPQRTAVAVLVAAGTVAAYKAFRHWIEREPDQDFALNGAAPELLLGLAIGAGLFSLAVGIVALLGGFEVLGLRGAGQIWSMLAVAVFSGVFEETLFRGILLRQLERLAGSWIAIAITAALFGAAHIFNPDSSWFAAFAIAVEAGLLLGAAYVLTRRLWLAIGIHAAWNFTQGWVFSIPVSGGEAPLGLLITRRTGPDWLTGGAFGLEASVIALVVATLAGAGLIRLAQSRAKLVPPPWRKS